MRGGGGGGVFFFFFKQKTAYEMCGRDWSSDVCSSDLISGPQIVIWQTSSKKCSITKIFESAPLENASRFEKEICLEFVEKVPVSGDTLEIGRASCRERV